MHVKICGITNADDAVAAARSGADFLGFILAPSPRRVAIDVVRAVVGALPPGVQPVLVFRDAPLEEVLAAVQTTRAGWLQFHGRESPAYLREVQARLAFVHVLRAWEIVGPAAEQDLRLYLEEARRQAVRIDAVLLDAPKGGPHPGFERLADISRSLVLRPPAIWCAGGLTPANVATAVAVGCYDGVDVASGVESRPGIKDHDAVRRFVAAARPATK